MFIQKLSYSCLLLCVLCSSANKLLSQSQLAIETITQIAQVYGSECNYQLEYDNSLPDDKKAVFEIEMMGSERLEKYAPHPELAASNIALLFHQFTRTSANKYGLIRSIVHIGKEKYIYSYPTKLLEKVFLKTHEVDTVFSWLRKKDYVSLGKFLDNSSLLKYSKEDFFARIERSDSLFGFIKKSFILGFRIYETNNNIKVLHFSGNLSREGSETQFSIDLDFEAPILRVFLINFKL